LKLKQAEDKRLAAEEADRLATRKKNNKGRRAKKKLKAETKKAQELVAHKAAQEKHERALATQASFDQENALATTPPHSPKTPKQGLSFPEKKVLNLNLQDIESDSVNAFNSSPSSTVMPMPTTITSTPKDAHGILPSINESPISPLFSREFQKEPQSLMEQALMNPYYLNGSVSPTSAPGTLDRAQLSALQNVSGFPDASAIIAPAELSALQNVSGFPDASAIIAPAELSALQNVSGFPDASAIIAPAELSALQKVSGLPDTSTVERQGIAELSQLEDVSGVIDTSAIPTAELSALQNFSGAPDTSAVDYQHGPQLSVLEPASGGEDSFQN
ncbi:MAG TPA: hypothetical protein PLY23_03190, partial [Alphaproteobacteria bacterium]|nr:hypothetical protein [Alphaproteobacteria bacterium]